MGQGGHVADQGDLQTHSLQCTDSGLTASAGTLHVNLNRLQTVIHSDLGCGLGSGLSGEGGGLTGALEAELTGGSPRDRVACNVGHGDDGVIESVTVTGYPAKYVNFRHPDESVWLNDNTFIRDAQ